MDDQRDLGVVEGKLDFLIASFSEHRHEMRESLASQEKRITESEKWQSRWSGYTAGVSAAVAAIVGLLLKALGA